MMFAFLPGRISALLNMCTRSVGDCAYQCLHTQSCIGFEVEDSCAQNSQHNLLACSLLSDAETAVAPSGDHSQSVSSVF